jgi:hypothetical protein
MATRLGSRFGFVGNCSPAIAIHWQTQGQDVTIATEWAMSGECSCLFIDYMRCTPEAEAEYLEREAYHPIRAETF